MKQNNKTYKISSIKSKFVFLLTKPKNITLFVFKIFADWQKTDLGKLALSQLDSFNFEAPAFNGLSNDPFSNTHEMTNNDILDYQSKLGYRYDTDMGQNKEVLITIFMRK